MSSEKSSSSEDSDSPSPKRPKVDNGGSPEKKSIPERQKVDNGGSPEKLSIPEPAADPEECTSHGVQVPVLDAPDSVMSPSKTGATPAVPENKPAVPETVPVAPRLKRSNGSPLIWHGLRNFSEDEADTWGHLLSQTAENPNVAVFGPNFSIGSSRSCNLILKDRPLCECFCEIRRAQIFQQLNIVNAKCRSDIEKILKLPSPKFKIDLGAAILDGKEIDISFENFPYYLSANTKNVLVAACFIYLKHKEHQKYTLDLTAINPRILLLGPAGSEIYQETLAKALAKHFGAKLLIFDSHLLLGGLSSKESESLKDGFNTEKSCSSAKQSSTITDIARTMDPSANEIETSTSSEAPASSGLESQHNLDRDKIPSTTVTAKKCLFKLGM